MSANFAAKTGRVAAGGSLLIGGIAGALVLAPQAGAATTYTVTNTNDSGAGSLRQALVEANSNPGADVIVFNSVSGTINLLSRLEASDSVSITGPGSSVLTVDASTVTNGSKQVFYAYDISATDVSISGLHFTGADSSVNGGAITVFNANLTLDSMLISDNAAEFGGAVFADNVPAKLLTIIDSIFDSNSALYDGGAVYSYGTSQITITGSTFKHNIANFGGGVAHIDSDAFLMTTSTVSGNIARIGSGGVKIEGIYVPGQSETIITDSIIDNNSSMTDWGGGLYLRIPYGTVTLTHTSVSGHTAKSGGGGIDVDSNYTTLEVYDSVIANNSTLYDGGGITFKSSDDSTLVMANTTMTGNTAESGGAIFMGDEVSGNVATISQSTISENTGLYDGGAGTGGIYFDGSLTLSGTIISGNYAADGVIADFYSPYSVTVSSDSSLLGDGLAFGSNVSLSGSGNVISSTPGLGALADNGGATMTMALLDGSAAIDAGPSTVATFPGNSFDQRGTPYVRVYSGQVDIGAFEVQPDPAPPTTTTTVVDVSTTLATDPVVPAFAG